MFQCCGWLHRGGYYQSTSHRQAGAPPDRCIATTHTCPSQLPTGTPAGSPLLGKHGHHTAQGAAQVLEPFPGQHHPDTCPSGLGLPPGPQRPRSPVTAGPGAYFIPAPGGRLCPSEPRGPTAAVLQIPAGVRQRGSFPLRTHSFIWKAELHTLRSKDKLRS